jgi:ABC-2 type transport system permease protein
MPHWARIITDFNPLRYFIEVMRMVVLKGSGLYDLRYHFLIIILFAVVLNTWAILHYRKTT